VSEDKKTVVKMAYIYSQEGRWDKAIAEYKKLIKLDPEDFNAQNMLGDVYVKKGEQQPAYDYYMVAAEAYNRLGQTEKATVVYRKIAKLDAAQLNEESKKKQAVFQRQVDGESAMEANDLDKAVEAFKAVLVLDPERFEVYQRLGDLYIRKGQSDLAVKQYNEIADIYFKNKLYKKAAPVYKKIIELDPANVEAHAAMGEIHSRSGNESDAKKEYLLIAEAMLGKGDLETALAYSKKAVALKSIEAYYYLGQVYLLQKKYDEAKAEFEKLLKFKLNHVGALVSMGRIFEGKGQADEALKHYQRALKVEKGNPEALLAAASLLEAKGEKVQAAAHYQEASVSFSTLNDAAKSQEYAAKAVALNPALGQAASAPAAAIPAPPSAPAPVAEVAPVSSAPPAPAVAPAPPPPLPELSRATQAAEAPPSLPEPERSAADPAEEIRSLMNLADNYSQEGSWSEAIEIYESVLKLAPQDSAAQEGMAAAYAALGKVARDAAPKPVQPSAEEKARLAAEAAAAEAAKAEAAAAEAARVEAAAKAEAATAAARKAAEEEAARKAALEQAAAAARKVAEEEAAAAARLEQLKRQAEEEQRKLEEMRQAQEQARAKVEAEEKARREADEAKRLAEEAERHRRDDDERRRMSEAEMRKSLEAEIRKQLEDEMRRKAEEEIRARMEAEMRLRMEDERRKAEEEGRRRAEDETRRRLEQESKRLEAEKADVRRQMEADMRKAIEAQERARSEREALEKLDLMRKKEEKEQKEKLQAEVLARVQSQQREGHAKNQKIIDDIKRKVEEANRAAAEAALAPSKPGAAPASPAAPVAAQAETLSAGDDMDDFMTEPVADIYTKQGLIPEAVRIYERILSRQPGNADVRRKLEALKPTATVAPKPAHPEPPAQAGPGEPDAKKKSKVSYL
jgi:tetratricopeptide (TPR) repeat protein